VDAESLTAANTGLTLLVAFNYGARQELTRACQTLAQQVADGHLKAADITPQLLAGALDTAAWPDPDLLIRTGGEERISNFLLWQCAYTEFVFLPGFWPDFDAAMLDEAIGIYHSRDRRFGGLKAQSA
jgi:undecaprenyl diphosphate synthase